ncbi:MAG: cache domain-containing protein [Pseudomonadota bacterium]
MRSVRLRLLVLALIPLAVLTPVLLGIAMVRWIDKFDDLLIAKVASDLRVAEEYLRRIEQTRAEEVDALAQSLDYALARAAGQDAEAEFLAERAAAMQLDFLTRATDEEMLPAAARPVARSALPDEPAAALALYDADALAAADPELAARARIDIVPTEAAREISRDAESRGMLLLAAARVAQDEGVLVGGQLLNRNLAFIDRMNALIYRDADQSALSEDAPTGTTTLFLDDVRISTNVRLFEGSRALGTRVSEVVWQQVMMEGETWLDRAFVVNDWYISGYIPMEDLSGNRIGMLYTGFLERPFTSERNLTILGLILAFLAVLLISAPIFFRLARGIFSPLEQMTATMASVEHGKLDARIGKVESQDEIGQVARHLDRLLDQVEERDEALRGYAGRLNEMVDRRTQELQEANKKLEETFARLVMSEKLASIGEITAGVAHEINNPVAVIQGNLEVLRAELGEAAAAHQVELDLIDDQTHRINVIVGKLLQFSRGDELSDTAEDVNLEEIVGDALVLVAADFRQNDVTADVAHFGAPPVRMSRVELQQVFVNLLINAMQAMPGGGTITLRTGPAERDGVEGAELTVKDCGHGIAPERIDHVFDPFFTTKRGEGTGLGLSISQALVTKAGGVIAVDSTVGEGTTFKIWLPTGLDISSDDLSAAAE